VGKSAGSSEPFLRPLPAMSHDVEILDADDPYFGYDAENVPCKHIEREMRLIFFCIVVREVVRKYFIIKS
jgi:hypothetical protein